MSGPSCSPDQESRTTQVTARAAPSVVTVQGSRYEPKANGEAKPQLLPRLVPVLSGGRRWHIPLWLADDQPEGPQ